MTRLVIGHLIESPRGWLLLDGCGRLAACLHPDTSALEIARAVGRHYGLGARLRSAGLGTYAIVTEAIEAEVRS